MFYVRLAGGLGNQLYQLAAAEYFARHGNEYILLDSALGRYSQPRSADVLRLLDSNKLRVNQQSVGALLPRLLLRTRVGRLPSPFSVNDGNFYHRENFSSKSFLLLDGYFQDQWSVEDFSESIENFNVCHQSSAATTKPGVCLIHVRGGDFLKHPLHQVVGVSYYIRTVGLARASGFQHFEVISDDRGYAVSILKELELAFPGSHFALSPPKSDCLDDFLALMMADARIIGNSTFSWWAMALSAPSSPTWSPSVMLRGRKRNFRLPREVVIDVQ